ncbi:GNAT family N-acetyltransferase [Halobellus rarus]|uniref:GNAT family N-acetyltransferase n=1 Tax=Halobellus rarus TaxID=1126237 RepID=A0ABD6CS26_9EURY|nr:GNAT family N-acetyltransferase [Halobellus rarus]
MEFVVLGWPPDGPTLRLDYRNFAYAGKFVMSNTGKAVVREAGDREADPTLAQPEDDSDAGDNDADDYDAGILAALAFNADRTDDATLWYRYVTVHSDAKGEELGPRLAAFVAPRAAERGYERLRIAVNNPFAYEAMYKAGFEWTGEETGVAELVLERRADGTPATGPRDADAAVYRSGLERFRERDLGEPEASFLRNRVGVGPPDVCDPAET